MKNNSKRVTFQMIKDYVEQENHKKIYHDCYICDVKDKNNLLKDRSGNVRHNQDRKIKCPESLRPVIEDVFRHFGLIS